MITKHDGGLAFPFKIDFEGLPPDAEPGKLYAPVKSTVSHPGMMLRDYFAAKAMQGMLTADWNGFDHIATSAYQLADAMIRARGEA